MYSLCLPPPGWQLHSSTGCIARKEMPSSFPTSAQMAHGCLPNFGRYRGLQEAWCAMATAGGGPAGG